LNNRKKKTFIIAEVGNLHDGSLDLAKEFIAQAASCGADAVKFQVHIFDAESLPEAPNPPYFKSESRKQYFERTSFDVEQWKILKNYAEKECKIEFMASVFSNEAVDLLENIAIKKHKIPSGEVTNLSLLEKVSSLGKPVLLSSGMSSWKELENAVQTLRAGGCRDITILQCSSVYPCPMQEVGLNVLSEMKKRFGLAVGFSDHTLDNTASIAAVVLGAEVIERHFTLEKDIAGSDSEHSLVPSRLADFIKEIRSLELALANDVDKDMLAKKLQSMKVIFEKSIVSNQQIKSGSVLSANMLAFKKPGDGIRADKYKDLLSRKVKMDIDVNIKIQEEMLEE